MATHARLDAFIGRRGRAALTVAALVLAGAAGAMVTAPAASAAPSADVYVATAANGGLDTNPCTKAKPCATITHAISVGASTVTVHVGAGNYDEAVDVSSGSVTITGAGSSTSLTSSTSTIALQLGSGSLHVTNMSFVDPAGPGNNATTAAIAAFAGTMTVANTTVHGSPGTGDIDLAIQVTGGATTISDSTITGAHFGIGNYGGTTHVDNTTISGNSGDGLATAGGSISVTDSTITGNGTGLSAGGGPIALAGTALDNNGPDCAGGTDDGYNVAHDASCGFTATGSANNAAVHLGALADNGGPTQTAAPRSDSAAADRIPTGTSATLNGTSYPLCTGTDQRGVARPQGSACDAGAVELATTTTKLKAQPATTGGGASVSLTATVSSAVKGLSNPAGTVSITDTDGSAIAGCTNLPVDTATGKATCSTTALARADHTLTATYTGTNGYASSSGTDTETVRPNVLYVNGTSGSDTNNTQCAQATPCQTIQHAVNVADSPATINVAGGTYTDQVQVASGTLTIDGAPGTTIAATTSPAVLVSGATTSVTVSGVTMIDPTGSPLSAGFAVYSGTLAVTDTTVGGSTPTTDDDYGVYAADTGVAQVSNSTIVGANVGVFADNGGTIQVVYSTITGNEYADVFVNHASSAALSATVVGNDPAHDCVSANGSTLTDGGSNLADDGSCAFTATNSANNAALHLGALARIGGPTQTVAPRSDSAAVDLVPAGSPLCTGTDQRGVARPQDSACDAGAVELAPSSTSLDAPTLTPEGQTVHLVAHVTATPIGGPTLPGPSGTVTFTDTSNGNAVVCADAPVDAAGRATCDTSTLSPGTHTISAIYTGTNGYHSSSITADTAVKATPTVAVTAKPTQPAPGATTKLTATVSGDAGTPSGTVAFTDDKETITNCDAVPLVSGKAVCTVHPSVLGNHTVTATYSGDGKYLGGSAQTTVGVGEALKFTSARHTTFTVGASGSFDVTTKADIPVTITESGALPDGVSFTATGDGTATLNGTPEPGTVGSYPITFTATTSLRSVTQSFTLKVVGAAPQLLFNAGPSPQVKGKLVGIAGYVRGDSGIATGTITVTDAGKPVAGCTKIALTDQGGMGAASCLTSSLTVGKHILLVRYSGDSTYAKATTTVTVRITRS